MSKITHTMGLYPNGSIKHNGVAEEDLAAHIDYQKCRPGRAFFVDGKCVYKGLGVNPADIAHWEAVFAAEPMVYTEHTRPYK